MNIEEIIDKHKAESVWLLDLSWHLYRNYFVFQHETAGVGGKPTGHMYGFLKTITELRTLVPNSVIVICQDGFPKRRHELLESSRGDIYKADRPELEYDFFKDINTIKGFLMPLDNVYWAYNPDEESDDLMYSLAMKSSTIVNDVVIYSGDDDLLQAVGYNIRVCRSHAKSSPVFITTHELQHSEKYLSKYHGMIGERLVLFRSIIGDSSDKIKGIPRIPRKLVASITAQVGTLDGIFNSDFQLRIKNGLSKSMLKWIDVINQNEEQIRVNYQLMKLPIIDVDLEKVPVNIQAVKNNLQKLYLVSYHNYLESCNVS